MLVELPVVAVDADDATEEVPPPSMGDMRPIKEDLSVLSANS